MTSVESVGAFDLNVPRRIHIVGIAGAGLSAMAEVLVSMGHRLSGSDLAGGPAVERLRGIGVAVTVGHDPVSVVAVDVVVRSTAVSETDVEVVAARAAGVTVLSRADLLAAMCGVHRTMAISGTHGKTTTSALAAAALSGAGLDPSWVVGAAIPGLGAGGHRGAGEWLVVEADESDGTFLRLPRQVALVTNVEADHLDYHGSLNALEAAFSRFLAECPGTRLVCADDPRALVIGRINGARTYGTADHADYRITNIDSRRGSVAFDLAADGEGLGHVGISLPGVHNALNAAAALSAALEVGVGFDGAIRGLGQVQGVARRFQHRGEKDGVTFVDDYAHHPGEVAAAMATARSGGWDRLVCVFQPHRFTRTEALAEEFGPVLSGADVLVVTDIYGAGETPRAGVTGRLVADAVTAIGTSTRVLYEPNRPDLAATVLAELRPGDLCLTLGAGDLTTLADDLGAVL